MLTWDDCLERGEFLSRAFGGRIPMKRLRIQAFEFRSADGQLCVRFDFAEFPNSFFENSKNYRNPNLPSHAKDAKYNTLQAEVQFLGPKKLDISSLHFGPPDGYPYCDATLQRDGLDIIMSFTGDLNIKIHCDSIYLRKISPYFRLAEPIP